MEYKELVKSIEELVKENRNIKPKELERLIETGEKDDERFWKILKEMIHCNVPDSIFDFYKVPKHKFEAWIEKQEKVSKSN